jgi:hypothetical protein
MLGKRVSLEQPKEAAFFPIQPYMPSNVYGEGFFEETNVLENGQTFGESISHKAVSRRDFVARALTSFYNCAFL